MLWSGVSKSTAPKHPVCALSILVSCLLYLQVVHPQTVLHEHSTGAVRSACWGMHSKTRASLAAQKAILLTVHLLQSQGTHKDDLCISCHWC